MAIKRHRGPAQDAQLAIASVASVASVASLELLCIVQMTHWQPELNAVSRALLQLKPSHAELANHIDTRMLALCVARKKKPWTIDDLRWAANQRPRPQLLIDAPSRPWADRNSMYQSP